MNQEARHLPPWIKVRYSPESKEKETTALLREFRLNTICEEGLCPNRHECFNHGLATFMLLGRKCTRNCHYCHVEPGKPTQPDPQEPERVARAIQKLQLNSVVITSVTRDDLPDQGASAFVRTVQCIRNLTPKCHIELLLPDFRGKEDVLKTLLELHVEVLSHNIETVEEIFPKVRPQGTYRGSLRLLARMKERTPFQKTKSGIMLGLGENDEQIKKTLHDLRKQECDFLTIGQYLQPREKHWPVKKYYAPEEFSWWKEFATGIGFQHVESGPLVRSSYRADKLQIHCTPNRRVSEQKPIALITLAEVES